MNEFKIVCVSPISELLSTAMWIGAAFMLVGILYCVWLWLKPEDHNSN